MESTDVDGVEIANVNDSGLLPDADVTASITAVTRRFPPGYGVPALRVLGRDDLRRLEERIKHLLKLEFNLPSNLWLGPSGENRSGGSTAKGAQQVTFALPKGAPEWLVGPGTAFPPYPAW